MDIAFSCLFGLAGRFPAVTTHRAVSLSSRGESN
jgi:hypothetical protein